MMTSGNGVLYCTIHKSGSMIAAFSVKLAIGEE